jgi:hypothetical protein
MNRNRMMLPPIQPIPPGPEGDRAFKEDPFAWAARLYRMTKAEYLEWGNTRGRPLCGCRTSSGALCRNQVGDGGFHMPDAFNARHRKYACGVHAPVLMGRNNLAADRRRWIAIPCDIDIDEMTIEEMILWRITRELDGRARELVKVSDGYLVCDEDGGCHFDTIEELMKFLGVARRAAANEELA